MGYCSAVSPIGIRYGLLQFIGFSSHYRRGGGNVGKIQVAGNFKNGSNGTTDDYTYDANGNLNLDNNKAISSITYNHLNLPTAITVTGKGTIAYTYDAAGNKLTKKTIENPVAVRLAQDSVLLPVVTTALIKKK